ncbi:MAG: Sugar isomerase (SIS) [Microgenomates group bacterium GW2011_GWA1_48_10]|uniref:SIS domain-containing protein n=1 Tax=Candidatus Gottesmanbacteria bacterium RIFCSPHIGHO2_01_FULL_47_48 TaxID=1798381 RepID=A0A1F6A514_9BACT|nr:MAG: Sugar isomerase (SIS) [Microgenomates group bacterium GW2011_GWA1_48_10]OGG19726.1 MAG: hypothetical protein A2721_01065 [Candidatus Gottesmanbacteria bacterium RIFCSPHIGHO2_01_FULL_47_48]
MKHLSLISDYQKNVTRLINDLDVATFQKMIVILDKAYRHQQLILVIGNGGSAATAAHLACDLAKTVRSRNHHSPMVPGFRAISLPDNVPTLTAWANDFAYDRAFEQEVINLGQKGDVLIAISSSGNSPNILRAVKAAREKGLVTLGISGFGGGKLARLCDQDLVFNHHEYGPVEDMQLVVCHLITAIFQKKLATGQQ